MSGASPAAEALPTVTSVYRCKVAWGECDPAGIIFYPTYFHWFDSATWQLFAHVGLPMLRLLADGNMMPLVAADIRFHNPAKPGDECEVRTRIERWGGKSFVVAHDVYRADGELLATGTETRVWICKLEGVTGPMTAQTIPAELKARFCAK